VPIRQASANYGDGPELIANKQYFEIRGDLEMVLSANAYLGKNDLEAVPDRFEGAFQPLRGRIGE